jgi:putative methyltransferase (TIGR04325 family)
MGSAYKALLGYRRPFASLVEANAAVAPYDNGGHQSPLNRATHLRVNRTARPSDYAAMFHIDRLLPGIRRVFDLGGNVGNLFYCYRQFLEFPADLTWHVNDLPENMAAGELLAKNRGVPQLHFVHDWQQAGAADLLLVSGSLHYLEKPLPLMVSELPCKPRYVLINRTPLTEGPDFATIQDDSSIRVAAMIYNRRELIEGFEALDYVLVDEWQCHELSLFTPGYPEHTVPYYSGMLFRAPGAG